MGTFPIHNLIGLLLLILTYTQGAFIRPSGHTLPTGLQSLDGSDPNGGCPQECFEVLQPNVCSECTGVFQLNSSLVDGVYPEGMIDTTLPDWAMDFFTVSRNGESMIRIGFDFPGRFNLRGIELKLFNCESLGTTISNINVYGSLVFPTFLPPSSSPDPIGSYQIVGGNLDCNSLTTIVISTNTSASFVTYFIEFSYPTMDTNTAVYLAEIRFSDEPIIIPNDIVTSTPQLLPSLTAILTSNELITSTTTEALIVTVTNITTRSAMNNPMAISTLGSVTTTNLFQPPYVPTCTTCNGFSLTVTVALIVVIIILITIIVILIVSLVIAICKVKRNNGQNTVSSNTSNSGAHESFPLKQNEAYGEVHRRGHVTSQPAAGSHDYDYISDIMVNVDSTTSQ